MRVGRDHGLIHVKRNGFDTELLEQPCAFLHMVSCDANTHELCARSSFRAQQILDTYCS